MRDKIILLTVAVAAIVYGSYKYLYIPANLTVNNLQEEILIMKQKNITPLDEKLRVVEGENVAQSIRIQEIKLAEMDKGFNTRDFLIFLSTQCENNRVKLVKFNDLGIYSSKAETRSSAFETWKLGYNFELRGKLEDINKVFGSIKSSGIKHSVGSMSLRQDRQFSYLERFFDGISKLEWYENPIAVSSSSDIEPIVTNTFENNVQLPSFMEDEFLPEIAMPTPEPTHWSTQEPTPESAAKLSPDATPEDVAAVELTPGSMQESVDNGQSTPSQALVDEKETESTLPEYELSYFKAPFADVFDWNLMSNSGIYPKIMWLNTYSSDEIFRINITVEFTMYSDPELSRSGLGQGG